MTNGAPLGTEQDVVYRVTSSEPSKTLKLDDGTVMKGVVRLENLEGVEFGDKGYLFGDCWLGLRILFLSLLLQRFWRRMDGIKKKKTEVYFLYQKHLWEVMKMTKTIIPVFNFIIKIRRMVGL